MWFFTHLFIFYGLFLSMKIEAINSEVSNELEEENELVVLPFDVRFNAVSSMYWLLSFKIMFYNETLTFNLASQSTPCQMNGTLLFDNHTRTTAEVSICDGIAGIVDIGKSRYLNFLPVLEDDVVINVQNISKTEHIIKITDPVTLGMLTDTKDEESTNRARRRLSTATVELMNESGKYVLLYYMKNGRRRYHSALRVNEKAHITSYIGTAWYAYTRDEQVILFNDRSHFFVHPSYRNKWVRRNLRFKDGISNAIRVRNLPRSKERYMEVVVICDATFIRFYGGQENADKYTRAVMLAVNRIYQHKSLNLSLHIVLKKIVFEENLSRLRIPRNYPKPALRMACKYAFDWRRRQREKFDFAVILTKTKYGVGGYASVYQMCAEYRSCTLVSDRGFQSAFLIAHEMAHSLGVLHDGDNNRCASAGSSGSIMYPTVFSSFNKYHWSVCSKVTMQENLRSFSCLNDKPPYYVLDKNDLPGVKFDLDQQCHYRMGRGHTACLGARDPQLYCRFTFCRRPKRTSGGRRTCAFWSMAPPDGTKCAKGKWCIYGRCVPKGDLSPTPIHGGWSNWQKWGTCKGACGKGVQFRERRCNNPEPQFEGKKCSGGWQDWRVCEMEACRVEKLLEDQRLDQCKQNGQGWNWLPNTEVLQTLEEKSVTDCWSVVTGGCVTRHNIGKYLGRSLQECQELCIRQRKCKAIEFGFNHGGSRTKYLPGFCQLQDHDDPAECDGKQHNLNLYIRKSCAKQAQWSLNPCNITCVYPKQRLFRHGHKIDDGRKCYKDRDDVCVSGNCWRLGCDGVRDSTKTYDVCGECGGSGTSCYYINITLTVDPRKPKNTILVLPPGTTNLRVEKKGIYKGFIAVRHGIYTYYYDKPPPLYLWYYFKLAGSTFRYQISNDNTQVIYTQGPTTDTSELQLVFRDRNYFDYKLELNVTYYVKKKSQGHLYLWQHKKGSTGECSVPCGGGVKSISPICLDMRTKQAVDGSKCSLPFVHANAVTIPCNTRQCKLKYEYVPGKWGKCNTCNKLGHQTRELSCVRKEEGKAPLTVNVRYCSNAGKPFARRNCYIRCLETKCTERNKRCPDLKSRGFCKYQSIRRLCCRTCKEDV